MEKDFLHIFSRQIWRIIPNAAAGSTLWAIELRDASQQTVSVAILDSASGSVIWEGIPEGMDWWASLTAFSGDRFFVHHYRYPELPEPTDLSAYSASNGNVEWSLPNFLLVKLLEGNYIEVATKSAVQFSYRIAAADSGELLPDNTAVAPAPGIILSEPVRYRKDSSFFEKLAQFIQETTDGHVPIAIDYLEKRPFMIFSYYIYNQDKTVQYLLIVTDQRELVYTEKLSEEREGIGRSTMILKESKLVYLKNNNEFSSLTLS